MRRAAVRIAYLGKDFCGSQYQPGYRTVMGDVLKDLERISGGGEGDWFDLKAAGRTDRGVNALDNVVVFNTTFDDDDELLKALNSVSKGIFYKRVATVSEDFNPRYANSRTYRYVLPSEGIDLERAKECSKLFLGKHDFVRFCKIDDKPTEIDLTSIEMDLDGDRIILTFTSQFFLWNMIRKIVAAIELVGKGERTMDDVRDALNGKEVNFGLARPDALTLTEVRYDYIQFNEPSDRFYKGRVKEELFADSIREDFLRSL
ncbi:MAG: tRNA pseudouridine(38-40) synthase TruA [Candidatus Methanomethylophilaceae archaeon]|nr:tRNA pseudouridine(38-40) synthase TruA [Candidatus Methanomethylophilaceae archaeon]